MIQWYFSCSSLILFWLYQIWFLIGIQTFLIRWVFPENARSKIIIPDVLSTLRWRFKFYKIKMFDILIMKLNVWMSIFFYKRNFSNSYLTLPIRNIVMNILCLMIILNELFLSITRIVISINLIKYLINFLLCSLNIEFIYFSFWLFSIQLIKILFEGIRCLPSLLTYIWVFSF